MLGLRTEVFSDGPVNATLAIVGEGPGETEVRHPQRLPFVGGAGRILWDSGRKYKIDRSSVYVTNVVKRQISLSKSGNDRHVVHRDELEKWIGLLKWELEQLPNVRYVLAMGNFALEALLGEEGITNWRGSVIDTTLPNGRVGKVVCTFNPAYVVTGREPRFEPIFQMDIHKLDMVNRNVFKPYLVNEIINPTYKEALAYIRDLARKKKPVSLDIETPNNATSCIGIGSDAHEAMCINFRDQETNRFTLSQEADIWYALHKLCESNRIVAQNGNFDSYWTWYKDKFKFRVWFDTLLAHHTLYPRLPHSLAFLTSQYTNHPFYKDEGKEWKEGGDIETYWRYNCKDVAITYGVHERLSRELEQQGLAKFFFEHVMRVQPHLVQSTVHGLAIDQTVKDVVNEQINEDVKKFEAEFHRLVQDLTEEYDYYPNPNSWQQLQELFFEKLSLQGKGRSTDEANRDNMIRHVKTTPLEKEMLTALTLYKQADKFRGTYAESKDSPDGRFRSEYKQFGVTRAPGRLSSAAIINREGGNIQNQPVLARSKFVADPGCVFIYFDLGQAEARVVAWRANILKWKHQFEQARIDGKYDAHRALASDMFRVPYDEVPTYDFDEDGQPTIRYIAKRCRHGLNYRMQKWKLAEVTGLPYHSAARNFSIYHRTTPELVKWWDAETEEFRKHKEVYNALGRRFKVIQRLDDDLLDSLIANYPQSTVGDKVVRVWYQCAEDRDWPTGRARIAIDVHDNLVGIAEPRVAKTCLRIMKKYAEEPLTIQDIYKNKPEQLIIPAELKISTPTLWNPKAKVDWQGKKMKQPGAFVCDSHGLHRWAHMEVVHL